MIIFVQLAHEAEKCEEKEEKLVKDAVQHLTQANIQIKDLHHQFTHKVRLHRSTSPRPEGEETKFKKNVQTSVICEILTYYSHDTIHVSGFQLMMNEDLKNSDTDESDEWLMSSCIFRSTSHRDKERK